MQYYKYDTAPLGALGIEKGISSDVSSLQALSFPEKGMMSRPKLHEDTFDRPQLDLRLSRPADESRPANAHHRRPERHSNTWTSSTADVNLISKQKEVTDTSAFAAEYNRLARKYGIRQLVLGDFPADAKTTQSLPSRRSSWFSRILHQESNTQSKQSTVQDSNQILRHRRSISDLALNLIHHQRKEGLKNEDLRGLTRLCGKSMFYLPAEYTPGSLVLPTCLRATAQYLVQHAQTSGIFRVPGSVRVVNALYDYYCTDVEGEDVATTTRCPNLPSHLNCGVHDVGSTFKKFLAGLPGGILGSLALFDALVAIHSQLHGCAETTATKESKIRARLIALAISTVKSQYQRELICAVFGLLCFVGRTAENAKREDGSGRPLPTSDLMGYSALSVVFGPLLLGDLLNLYSMKLADPALGLIVLPITPRKSGRHRRTRRTKQQKPTTLTVDRILVANDITEMLLVHWRDVVRHLKNLDVFKDGTTDALFEDVDYAQHDQSVQTPQQSGRGFSNGPMPEDCVNKATSSRLEARLGSPPLERQTQSPSLGKCRLHLNVKCPDAALSVDCSHPRSSRMTPIHRLPHGHSTNTLSPPSEAEDIPGGNTRQKRGHSIVDIASMPDPSQGHDTQPNVSQLATRTSREAAASCEELSSHAGQPIKDAYEVPSTTRRNVTPNPEPDNEIASARRTRSLSQGTTRRHPSRSTGDTDQMNESHLPSGKQSTAGHTPFGHKNIALQQDPRLIYHSTVSENDVHRRDGPLRTRLRRTVTDEDKTMSPVYLGENVMLPPGIFSTRRRLPGKNLPVYVDLHESPGRRASFKYPSHTPSSCKPDCGIGRQIPDTSQETSLQGQSSVVDTSSTRSPQILNDKKISMSPSTNGDSPSRKGVEHFYAPTRNSSAASRWQELANNSLKISPADLKERRMLREKDLVQPYQAQEPTPVPLLRVSTPEWKRRLLKKRSEERKKTSTLTTEKPHGHDRPSLEAFPAKNSPDITKEETPPAKSLNVVAAGLCSQRSPSKPVTGTVRSIAARFDSASQDSSRGQLHTMRGESNTNLRSSHSFLSTDATVQSPTRPPEMPVAGQAACTNTILNEENAANQITVDFKNTPGRFRATMSRLSHSLWPNPSQNKANKSPSKPVTITIQPRHGFMSARNEPFATPSRLSHRRSDSERSLINSAALGRGNFTCREHSESASRAFDRSTILSVPLRRSEDFNIPNSIMPDCACGSSDVLRCQIRALQRQLGLRYEEIQLLRRQLDVFCACDTMTLSDQLFRTKEECKLWRKRVETAEQRIAIFEKFTTRFRSLKEGIDTVANLNAWITEPCLAQGQSNTHGILSSSSTLSNHMEDQEAFRDRIPRSLRRDKGASGDGDNNTSEPISGGTEESTNARNMRTGCRDISRATAELWVAAEELSNAQGFVDNSIE